MYANDETTFAPFVKEKMEELKTHLESLGVDDNSIYSASPPMKSHF